MEKVGVANGWQADILADSRVAISLMGEPQGMLHWELLGEHNRMNALAALAAARHAGIPVNVSISALMEFKNVTKSFGDRLLIDDLSFIVPPGTPQPFGRLSRGCAIRRGSSTAMTRQEMRVSSRCWSLVPTR